MAAAAASAARSVLRSSAARSAVSRVTRGASSKPKSAFSSLGISKQKPLHRRVFRSPVEMSCCVETLLPFHTATASALLNSMLSVSRRPTGWTPEGKDKTR